MAPTHDGYDVIVIGSGIGGLTVASLMAQMRKKRVLVLERHFKLGGFTHEFSRPGGYSWDVGLHYVGGMARGEMSRNLMDLVTGGAVQWNKMQSPFEKFVYPDFTFDVPDDKSAYQQALVERFPDERPAIVQYFKDLASAAKWFSHHLVKQCAPFMISAPLRFGAASDALALSTTGDYLDRNFRDPKLKAILASQWGDYGLPPSQSAFAIHATVTSSYFDGGYYPEGGAGTIAASVARIVEANGGNCLVNHTVREIIVEGGVAVGVKVAVSRGSRAPEETEFRAPMIVSDAGALTTFSQLVPREVNVPFRAELEAMPAAGSAVTLYLGLKDDPSKLGFRGENHWLYGSYDHDDLYSKRGDILRGRPGACYLSFPSLKDPLAKGHTAEIISFIDYAAVERWRCQPWRKRDDAYQQLKSCITESMLAFVEQRYPGFRSLIDYSELSTPLTVEHFTGHSVGSIYGLAATPDRFRTPWLTVRTPVKHLMLTGTDVSCLGIVGAMMGGVATAAALQGSLGFVKIMAASRKPANVR